MNFRYVAQGKKNAPVYQGQTASTGEVLEFTGPFVAKAIRNPDFEALPAEDPPRPRAKKKITRKKRAAKKRAARHG